MLLGGLSVLAILLWRFPLHIAIGSLALAIGLDCLGLGDLAVNVYINIGFNDVACVLIMGAALITALRSGKLPAWSSAPIFVLFALAVVNLFRGASEFGIKAAGNGVRDLVYLVVPPIGFLLLGPALRLTPERVAKVFIVIASFLGTVALCRWFGLLPTPEEFGFRDIARPIPARYALVIGQASLGLLYLHLTRGLRFWGLLLAGAFGFMVIFLQHRSVWAAIAAALLWLTIRSLRTRTAVNFWLGLGGTAFFLIVVVAAAAPNTANRIATILAENVDEPSWVNSSWYWRTQGYDDALQRTFSGGTLQALMGPPAGRFSEPQSDASFASLHIHNCYISTLAYYGIVGEILLIAWLGAVAVGSFGRLDPRRQETKKEALGRVLLQSVLVSELVYFIAYSGGIVDGAVIGIIWTVGAQRQLQFRMPMAQRNSPVLGPCLPEGVKMRRPVDCENEPRARRGFPQTRNTSQQ
jgi:hypothetical protein